MVLCSVYSCCLTEKRKSGNVIIKQLRHVFLYGKYLQALIKMCNNIYLSDEEKGFRGYLDRFKFLENDNILREV